MNPTAQIHMAYGPCDRLVLDRRFRLIGFVFTLLSVFFTDSQLFAQSIPISMVKDLVEVSPELAKLSTPFKLSGIVTYVDPAQRFFHLQDETGAVMVRCHNDDRVPAIYERVEVNGLSGNWNNHVVLAQAKIQASKKGAPPEAPEKKLSASVTGDDMFGFVKLRGDIRRVSNEWDGKQSVTLADGKDWIIVNLLNPGNLNVLNRQLLGATVSVTGVLQPRNRDGHKAYLAINSPNDIVISAPAPLNPFDKAMTTSIENLADGTNQLYRIRGKVIGDVSNKKQVKIQDETGAVRIDNQDGLPPFKIGDMVEAIGYADKDKYGKILKFVRSRIQESLELPANRNRSYLSVLHSAYDIRQLTPAHAAAKTPVRIRANVTQVGKAYDDFFIQDQTGAIYVAPIKNRPDLKPGDLVVVSGVTGSGTFSPIIDDATVSVLNHGTLPKPEIISPEDIPSGRLDATWVELDGIAQFSTSSPRYHRLRLSTRLGPVIVLVHKSENISKYIDRHIRVTGVYLANYRKKSRSQGFEIMVPSTEFVTLLDMAPHDPFHSKKRSIGELADFDPQHEPGRQSLVVGEVTAYAGEDGFFLEDSTGGIYVQLRNDGDFPPMPELGESLEVAGYLEANSYSMILREAVYHDSRELFRIKAEVIPSVRSMLATDPSDTVDTPRKPIAVANRLIKIRAEYLRITGNERNLIMELRDGNYTFKALLPPILPANSQEFEKLLPGSLVEITGVCRIEGDQELMSDSRFVLVMRDLNDYELVSSPPWWNQSRFLMLVYGMFLLMTTAIGMVIYFRYRLRKQSRVINERLTREMHLEDRYRELVEQANDVIFTLDAEGIITGWNNAGEALMGLTRDKLIGQPLNRFLAGGSEKDITSLYSETPKTIPLTLRTARQQLITLEVATRPMLDRGIPVGLQAIARDVTERNLLEHRMREITKMQAVGQLAGGVAHDFNNLLTVINGNCDLLARQTNTNPIQRELLEEVRNAGAQAATVTRQLLAFGRQTVINPKSLDLNNVVHGLIRVFKHLIGDSILLSIQPDEELQSVRVDPTSLEQAILNLVVNARDAMLERGGTLTIRTSNLADGWVRLEIADTGTGMPKEIINRIFEPYFTTKPTGQGTGLGLAMVSGFMEQSCGRISVRSEVGIGTTFQLEFEGVRQEGSLGMRVPDSSCSPGPSEGQIILLVEDEPSVQLLEKRILESGKYQVIAACSAEEAIEIMATHTGPLDMLVTDVVMPGKNGRELAEELRKQRPDLKVLFMSGYTPDEVLREGVEADAAHFLQKPFTPSELLRKVREIIAPSVMLSETIVSV